MTFMCLGVPGQIVEILDMANAIAIADVAGVRRKVGLACILEPGASPETCIGDWVLIHVGFAMSRIDEAEARSTLAMLTALGDEDELAAWAAR
jgi:hydrogenase expression/formation protein HypC